MNTSQHTTILGLDIGTNSIGWALTEQNTENKQGRILGMGSRIIPMGAELSEFERGQAQTKNAARRLARGARKLNKRYKQRRNKLIYILQRLGMLPDQIKLAQPFNDPLKIDKVALLPVSKRQKQYTALDLLELRVKALHEEIPLPELGRIFYLFNQLRGYSGGGAEPEKEEDTDEEGSEEEKRGNERFVVFAKVVQLSSPEEIVFKNRTMRKTKVVVETEDGTLEGDTFLETLEAGESLELLVNIRKSRQGETVTFKLPNKTSWRKKMENLEEQLTRASIEQGRTVHLSEFFRNILRENRWARIRSNVVLRSRYQAEFDAVWNAQYKLNPAFRALVDDKGLLQECVAFIFPDRPSGKAETDASRNSKKEHYRADALEKGFRHLLRNQIIYYQRELKDQAELIANCRFETSEKAIARSHPVFQEFKIWEQINKLTINTKIEAGLSRKGEKKYVYEDRPLPAGLKEWLYEELRLKKEISFGALLSKLKKEYGFRENTDFLNGMNAKARLRGDDTRILLKKALGEELWQQLGLESRERQIELWSLLYHGKGNEYDLDSPRTVGILAFLDRSEQRIDEKEKLAIRISKIKFNRDYASLSLKAIENILPLVRAGKYFDPQLSELLREKIVRLLNDELDDPFEKAAGEYLGKNIELLAGGGIMNAYATILVYGRHTLKEYGKEEMFHDHWQIKRLKQGSLRNPLVEQVVNETLMVVKDIWKQFGRKPDEIRVELARELKNNADRRAKAYKANRDNQKMNDQIRDLLAELNQESTPANVEKYKLWLAQENTSAQYAAQYKDPSRSEIEKMRLWREQGHVSPYTGQPIPLSELFNRERYDVDHIIPQSRYFDDSLANKVICEKLVNNDKGNKTAMEYLEMGSLVSSVLSKADYIDHVNKHFHGIKRKNLLATKVPEDPVARQMKETQYIAVRVREELSRITEKVNTTTGGVTDYLRNQWGLTDKFKEILKERYERAFVHLVEAAYEKHRSDAERNGTLIQDRAQFESIFKQTYMVKKRGKWIIKGWSKRIDHRHHAIDALVISCTQPRHVKRLNDLNKELQTWLDENRQQVLPGFDGSPSELLDEIFHLEKAKQKKIFDQIEAFRKIDLPWSGFPEEAEQHIAKIIVSQKPKDKLLIQEDQQGLRQIKIRGQLHEGTLYGKSQGTEAYRVPLSKFAANNFATEKNIEKIVNGFLRTAIREHFKDCGNKKEEAFSAEGILSLNKKLAEKKNSRGEPAPHTPISSVKIFYREPSKVKRKKDEAEAMDALQRLDRSKAYNDSLYVKTGDNYLFALLEKNGKRISDILTFFDATNLLKDAFRQATDKAGFDKENVFKRHFEEVNQAKLLFMLRQGDPVYLPAEGEEVITDPASPLFRDFWGDTKARSRNIHYVTKYSGRQIYFIGHSIADTIVKGKEFGSPNAYEKVNGVSIREHCIKIQIDRLGSIKPEGV